jgi:NADH:ubiquinone oxidoreductase subunit E
VAAGSFFIKHQEVPMSEKTTCQCACCGESATEAELMVRLDAVLGEYQGKPGGLIPALQIAQTLFGYLPEAVLQKIARAFGKPYSEVAGVVSFYSFFSTTPRGKNLVRVCLGTACYVRGGKEVLDAMKKRLGIDVGQTTADRLFSLEVGRCFGACGMAPVVMVNDDVHQRVKPARIGAVLDAYLGDDAAGDKEECL